MIPQSPYRIVRARVVHDTGAILHLRRRGEAGHENVCVSHGTTKPQESLALASLAMSQPYEWCGGCAALS